jgi:hypothetical protein
MMKFFRFHLPAVAGTLGLSTLCAAPAQAAEAFAPVGAKATVSVEYRYENQGSVKGSPDRVHILREWRIGRQAQVVAELVAGKPQPLSQVQAAEPGQLAQQQRQGAQAQKAAAQMAPMMAGAEAVVAKCGGDERCIEREVMKMGFGMAGTRQLADAQRVGRETDAATQPGADRYQLWRGRTQKLSYSIDEQWHVVHADPLCVSLPRGQCTHDLTRKGGGDLLSTPTVATMEVDIQGSLFLMLPVPQGAMEVIETHTTNEPSGTHDWEVPKAPRKLPVGVLPASADKPVPTPIKLALKSGWRSQSGEQVVALDAGGWHGASGEGGRLVIRWRLNVP